MVISAPRKLLLAALGITFAGLAFLIGARAGASLQVMTFTGQAPAAVLAR